jgi:hypothetical protein
MRYTVVSSPFADHQLTELWLQASNPQAVTDASNRIEALLRNDPDRLGTLRSDGRRVIVLPPLAVLFEVLPDDRKVIIRSVRTRT